MKNKFLVTLFISVFALMAVLPAHAATESTLWLNALTGDEFANESIPSSGNYGRVAKAPAAAALTVVDDGTGNYVYQFAGNPSAKHAMIVYTYTSAAGTGSGVDQSFYNAQYQKSTARVNLPSKEGQMQLFSVSTAWSISVNSDTAGVLLKNGGAYYYDVAEGGYVNFIPDNTMSTNTWYTVEAVYNRQSDGLHMYGTVYAADGTSLGSSGWVHVSSIANKYLRTQISVSGYAEGTNILIDDVSLYVLTTTPITCNSQSIAEDYSSASFTFSEALDADTLTKDNVILASENPTLDVSDKYEIDYTDGTLTLTFDELPYNETYKITLTKNVSADGDIFGLSEEIEISFTTPVDPLAAAMNKDNVSFTAKDGGEIAAGDEVVTSVTLNNNSARKREYILLITSWNSDNECVAIRAVRGELEPNTSATPEIPAVLLEDSDSVIRVSLLDNWYNIIPVGDVVTYQLP